VGPVVDPETGLQYLRARYYDPATAQFLTRDPLEAETRSVYEYVDGDPLNRIDPSGERWTPNWKGDYARDASFTDDQGTRVPLRRGGKNWGERHLHADVTMDDIQRALRYGRYTPAPGRDGMYYADLSEYKCDGNGNQRTRRLRVIVDYNTAVNKNTNRLPQDNNVVDGDSYGVINAYWSKWKKYS